ncbi:hypothetical protein [Helicobacter sp. MIT 14-3879]|uniref:hypothetical protein n=1 Tax=Helicobacter sp. MIT 14-3879 TaxID=2040649 RepID=UPI000E1F3240|nr:hypothetical protein [Helicobacter sp. MIT 14-3879]RDU59099.1 hypothetical protein CQA44_11735 [Helicobacter sp. MIT 14-3879]
MSRQEKYNTLFEYAEICWASYSTGLNEGMFGKDSKGKMKNSDEKNKKALPTYHQALSESFLLFFDNYNVRFDSKRADKFVNRYAILAFNQDDETGFSATLFKDTKNDELILAIRGIDIFQISHSFWAAAKAGLKIFRGKVPITYYLSMLKFYDEKLKYIINDKKIVVTGHAFGGYLAQLFALSYPSIVEKVYTYNAVGVTSNQVTHYINKAVDITNEITTQVAFDFSIYDNNIDEFKSIAITDKVKNAIKLDNNLLVCSDKTIQNEIPKYLQEEFITTQQNSYDYQTAKTGAAKLYNEILKAPIGDNVFVKVRIDSFLPHTIDTEVFTLNKSMSEALFRLIKYLPNSHNELPKELQAYIYQVYTIDLMDTTTIMKQFGNHILATEVIELKLDVFKLITKYEWLKKDKAKQVLRGLKMASAVNWLLVLISIEDICNELLKQSLVSDNNPHTEYYINCYWCGWESLIWQ